MLRRLAVPVVAGVAVAACVPQVPFSPTAVTLGSGGKVKILQTEFEVGVVPEGGEESVLWHEPARDADLAVYVRTDSGLDYNESFQLGQLGEGKFRFHLKTMTRDEFSKEAPCALK